MSTVAGPSASLPRAGGCYARLVALAVTPPGMRVKPRLRGVTHQWAFFSAIPLGILVGLYADTSRARVAGAVFAASVVAMFGASALYHRVTWSPAMRPWLRRLDHAGIYGLIKFATIAGAYNLKATKAEIMSIASNKGPTVQNRGVGKPTMIFVLERMVDIAAKKVGLTPAEMRFRNFVKPEQMPYTTPSGEIYESGDYPECLRQAMALGEYDKFSGTHRPDIITYLNKEKGERIEVFQDEVMSITYFAASSDSLLRCGPSERSKRASGIRQVNKKTLCRAKSKS